MSSDCAQSLDQLCSLELPEIPGLRVRCAEIADHSADLSADELAAISKAIDKRRFEFATGRWLARQTMMELGLMPGAVARGEQRQPVWPAGILGSITHADDIAAVAVGGADVCRSVGIDLERWPRVTADLYSKLFTPAELPLTSTHPAAAGLMFSAKEAGYKATFPLAERFIGFQEAQIDVDWEQRRFSFRYVGEHSCSAIMEQGEGYFLISGDYALSLFVIR